ncbi:MAG TPA: hypothetical protein VNF49_11105 [Candidatus Binataceae bacterium]|nr:hypothetical protein [Candidatus Binataceae bacterium]
MRYGAIIGKAARGAAGAGKAARAPRARMRAQTARGKKEGPLSGALSRYGVNSPRLIAAACPASWPASGFPEENLRRYFFFFLPAFFFIFVFSFGLDFVAELLFFFTGIDTSLSVAAAGQAPETS